MGRKGVEYLESQALITAAKQFDDFVKNFNQYIKDINSVTDELLLSWHGEGRTEFEKDYSTIYRQLKDISDVLYELYDALIDADATYVQTDEDIAKSFLAEG